MNWTILRRAFLIAVVNCTVGIALVGFGPPKLVDREVSATIRLTPGELREWFLAAEPPSISANALLVYDVDAERILYSRFADVAMPPASLTKLMSALLALENGQLDDELEIMAEDLIGGATMGLVDGEVVTVEDLLWGMLIASGNDAAMALARHVGGDVDTFVKAMNAKAAELGLGDTQFVNPHGFDAEEHLSSAYDILNITLRLMEYPLFQEIVGTASTEVAGRQIANTNELLGVYPGAAGIKTGTTALAGQCLVANIQQDDHNLIIIVMGSSDRYSDVADLHQLYQSNYEWVKGDIDSLSVLNRLYGEDGRIISLQAEGESVSILQHRWGDPELQSYRNISISGDMEPTRSQTVGTVDWTVGDDRVAVNELTVR